MCSSEGRGEKSQGARMRCRTNSSKPEEGEREYNSEEEWMRRKMVGDGELNANKCALLMLQSRERIEDKVTMYR